ncbi:MAG TPA: cytochrome c [Bauldia sp.]|nr:cytochrome c [Bauldia sp.]
MIRKLAGIVVVLAIVGLGAFWFLSAPTTYAAADLPDHTPNVANGEYMFWAGGCSSCHAAPGASGDDLLKLGGGRVLKSDFGDFQIPNISPDKATGIGNWSTVDFVNAMKLGVRPNGVHLYPAFPYTSYQRMTFEDIIDLKGYLDTLPAVENAVPPTALSFPFSVRRGLGLWKLLYVDGKTYVPDSVATEAAKRGAYLVEGPGHCTQCHSPRNFYGGIIADRAYSGAPLPASDGNAPNITPDNETGIGTWTTAEIVGLMKTGFLPDFDVVGGDMAEVQRNLARLTAEDQQAIAEYLKSLPPIRSEYVATKGTGGMM